MHSLTLQSCCPFSQIPLHQGVWGSGSKDPRSISLDTRLKGVLSFCLRRLYHPEKYARCLLDRRLCGSQSQSGRGDEKQIPVPVQDTSLVVEP
jgi:hypothetical protein